jgi:hypothetical protein
MVIADHMQRLVGRTCDLDTIEISPAGLGIHFPKLDADIYLPAILEGLLGSRAWMTAHNARRGVKRSKAAAA